jgi:predicted metal-dependent hydrolase
MSGKCLVCFGGYILRALWQGDLSLRHIVAKVADTLALHSLSLQADEEMQQSSIRCRTNSIATYLKETERHEGN